MKRRSQRAEDLWTVVFVIVLGTLYIVGSLLFLAAAVWVGARVLQAMGVLH